MLYYCPARVKNCYLLSDTGGFAGDCMFYYISGALSKVSDTYAVIDAGGVGYAIGVTGRTAAALQGQQSAKLYVYFSARDDAVSLYGFLSEDELKMFKSLLTVNGVGQKSALALLDAYTPERLSLIIASDDVAALSKAPGVGKKTAARIVLEIRDKIGGAEAGQSESDPPMLSDQERQDALDALIALGYQRTDAVRAVIKVSADGMSAEDIIKASLKALRA